MDGFVGGETHLVSEAGVALGEAAQSVHSHAEPLHSALRAAAQAAGCTALGEALDRCAAAWQQTLVDLATQTEAVGVLADVGSADLGRAAGR
jgi:hypothetical protein